MAGLQEAEYIATYQNIPFFIEFLETLADEIGMVTVCFYAYHLLATARYEFQGDASCSCEKVEGSGIFKVNVTLEHIEDVLLGEVCCRARLECTGNVKMASLIFSCNDSHISFCLSI